MSKSQKMKNYLLKRDVEIKLERKRKKEIEEKIKSSEELIEMINTANIKITEKFIEDLASKVLVIEEKHSNYQKSKPSTKTERREQGFRKNARSALEDILDKVEYDYYLEFQLQIAISHYFNFVRFEKNTNKSKSITFTNQLNFITTNSIFDIFDFYFFEKRLDGKIKILSKEKTHTSVKLPTEKISDLKKEIEQYIIDKAHFLSLFSKIINIKIKYQVTPESFKNGFYFKRSQLYKDAYAHTIHNPSKKLYNLGV